VINLRKNDILLSESVKLSWLQHQVKEKQSIQQAKPASIGPMPEPRETRTSVPKTAGCAEGGATNPPLINFFKPLEYS
jgi:hypothetical protein